MTAPTEIEKIIAKAHSNRKRRGGCTLRNVVWL